MLFNIVLFRLLHEPFSWAVWRNKSFLPEELLFTVNYLGWHTVAHQIPCCRRLTPALPRFTASFIHLELLQECCSGHRAMCVVRLRLVVLLFIREHSRLSIHSSWQVWVQGDHDQRDSLPLLLTWFG